MTAVLTVLLILVGLPLLAWWVGGRGFWSRLRPRAEPDPWGDVVRRHRLSPSEAARVTQNVPRGLPLGDPRLRRAAVDYAGLLLEQETVRWPRTRMGRGLAGLAVAWFLAVAGLVMHRLLSGRPEDVNWVTVLIVAGFGIWSVRRRRALRRAVAVNADASGSQSPA